MKRTRTQAGFSDAGADTARTAQQAKQSRKQAGAWLKELRGRAGLSQIQLADLLGFKYYTLHFPGGKWLWPCFQPKAWTHGRAPQRRSVVVRSGAIVLLRSRTAPASFRGEAMTVVKFPRAMQALEGWKSVELQQLLSMSSSAISRPGGGGRLGRWRTEHGDPQFFFARPTAEYHCILSI